MWLFLLYYIIFQTFFFSLKSFTQLDSKKTKDWHHAGESGFGTFKPSLMELPKKNSTVYGYLVSYKYFNHINDVIRSEFTFKPKIIEVAFNISKTLQHNISGRVILIGVHMRRGDMLLSGSRKFGYKTPSKEYYQKAMDIMRNKYNKLKSHGSSSSALFLVASDDLPWARDHVTAPDVLVLPPASPEVRLSVSVYVPFLCAST